MKSAKQIYPDGYVHVTQIMQKERDYDTHIKRVVIPRYCGSMPLFNVYIE